MMDQVVKFSLKKKAIEIPIELEDGSVVVYEVRRASGESIENYLDENSGRIETAVDAEGRVQIKQIKTYKSMFVSLLKYCLYLNESLVPAKDIAKFPYDVQKGLFDEAQGINGLSVVGNAEVKN
ncbi:MAG: hypothetical protein WC372_10225 [Candidatus Neomarinimicrobiota bacterium]|nr:hypothetical protein [bacterium]